MNATNVPNEADVEKQIESEFLDEVRDIHSSLDVLLGNLRSKSANPEEALETLARCAHSLKNQGRIVNMPLINLATHQMDDYLSNIMELTPERIEDIQAFLDKISDILDGKVDDKTEDSGAKLIRELPIKKSADIDFGDITPQNIQILLVVPEKSMTHIIEREMAACGYRTCTVRNPFDAFEMAVRTKPDMIIASRELGEINGIDMACAFASMPKTQRIPFALLTSYNWGHPSLDGLPPRAALLQKNTSFGEGLAEALARFGIT